MRKLAAAIALLFSLTLPGLAFAQLTTGGSGLTATGNQAYGVVDPQAMNVGTFVGTYIIKPVIGLTGLIFLVLTVYAGFMWMTSGGDSKRVGKAKDILVACIVGAVIIASAYVIVNEVVGALGGSTATTTTATPPAGG